jgi:hypothetical protein
MTQIEILAHQLVVEAEAFLAELDAAAAAEYVAPDLDDEVDTHAVNYLRFISLESEAGASKTRRVRRDPRDWWVRRRSSSQEGADGAGDFDADEARHPHDVVDLDAAKKANPDLWGATAGGSGRLG